MAFPVGGAVVAGRCFEAALATCRGTVPAVSRSVAPAQALAPSGRTAPDYVARTKSSSGDIKQGI